MNFESLDENMLKQFLLFQKFMSIQKEVLPNKNNKEKEEDHSICEIKEKTEKIDVTSNSKTNENSQVLDLHENKKNDDSVHSKTETASKVNYEKSNKSFKSLMKNKNKDEKEVLNKSYMNNSIHNEDEIVENIKNDTDIVSNILVNNNQRKNSFDEIPIKTACLNFESLLEKEMINTTYEVLSNEKKMKIVNKSKRKVKEIIISKPEKNIKYKYYTDNFKNENDKDKENHIDKEIVKEKKENEGKTKNNYKRNRFSLNERNKIKDLSIEKIEKVNENSNIDLEIKDETILKENENEDETKDEIKVNEKSRTNEDCLLINDDINVKMMEIQVLKENLRKEKEIYHNKNTQLSLLIKEQKDKIKKFETEKIQHLKKMTSQQDEFEKYKENELKTIRKLKDKAIQGCQTIKITSKKDNEEAVYMKSIIQKLQEENKLKEQNAKLLIDSLKKQLYESNLLLEKVKKSVESQKEDNQKEERKHEELKINNINSNIVENKPKSIRERSNSKIMKKTYSKNKIKIQNDIDNQDIEINKKHKNSYSNIKSRINTNLIKDKGLVQMKNNEELFSYNYNNNENIIIANNNIFRSNEFNQFSKEEINTNDINFIIDNINHVNSNISNLNLNQANKKSKVNIVNNENFDKQAYNIKRFDEEFKKYDLIFPKQYSFNRNLIRSDKLKDNKFVNYYEGDIREVIFPSGVLKEIHPDGYQLVNFPNKDIKQLFPNGKMIYFFYDSKTIQFTIPEDKMQVFKFANGQIEKHYEDGTKRIFYPDGTIKIINNDGEEFSIDYDDI